MNHELNTRLAEEVMGWKNVGPLRGGNVPFGERSDDYNKDHPTNPLKDQVSDYSGSLDAAWQMEEEIERRGVRNAYIAALERLTEAYVHDKVGADAIYMQWPRPADLWLLIHATPEQRRKAALEAVREKAE